MATAPPTFSGVFADFGEFAEDFRDFFVRATGVAWHDALLPPNSRLVRGALQHALREPTLLTVESAAAARAPELLPHAEAWLDDADANLWQALEAIYGARGYFLPPPREAYDLHVACDRGTHTFCPHCKERCRHVLDAAARRRWGFVFAELAVNPRFVNYLPEERERPDDWERQRANFALVHWAAFHGDADALRGLAATARFRPTLEGRRGRLASEVAYEVARTQRSLRHADAARELERLELELEAGGAAAGPPGGWVGSTEARDAFAPPKHEAHRPAAGARPPAVPPADDGSRRVDRRREAPYRWPDPVNAHWPGVHARR